MDGERDGEMKTRRDRMKGEVDRDMDGERDIGMQGQNDEDMETWTDGGKSKEDIRRFAPKLSKAM